MTNTARFMLSHGCFLAALSIVAPAVSALQSGVQVADMKAASCVATAHHREVSPKASPFWLAVTAGDLRTLSSIVLSGQGTDRTDPFG